MSIFGKIGWHMQDILEEQIRVRAYQLWELAGSPFGDSDGFWREAEEELKFQQAREEIKTRSSSIGGSRPNTA